MRYQRWLCILLAVCLLAGCAQKESTEPGKIVEISAAEVITKMDQKEDFIVVFTQLHCKGCIQFLSMMEDDLPKHSLILYDVVLDQEADWDQALTLLQERFPKFDHTPDIYAIQNGEKKSRFFDEETALNRSNFERWVNQFPSR